MSEQETVNRMRENSFENEWLEVEASDTQQERIYRMMRTLDVTERNVEEVLQKLHEYRVIPKINTTTNT